MPKDKAPPSTATGRKSKESKTTVNTERGSVAPSESGNPASSVRRSKKSTPTAINKEAGSTDPTKLAAPKISSQRKSKKSTAKVNNEPRTADPPIPKETTPFTNAEEAEPPTHVIPFPPEFHDVTVQLTKKPGLLRLVTSKVPPPDPEEEADEDNFPLSMKFFGARIKGHPDEKKFKEVEETLGLKYEGDSEVIIENGRVTTILVPPEIMDRVHEEEGWFKDKCNWCREDVHALSPALENDMKVQQGFLARVLLLEMLMHVPSVALLAIQYYVHAIHEYFYSQVYLTSLFLIVLFVTVIWGVSGDLGRYSPCNVILLLLKTIAYMNLSALMTALFERWAIYYLINAEDLEDPDSEKTLKMVRQIPQYQFTYPVIVHTFIGNVMVFEISLALFFKFCRGNVHKDVMFWVAVTLQGLMIAEEIMFVLMASGKYLDGPMSWDFLQVIVSGLGAGTWELWRLYSLREAMEGRTCVLNEKEYLFFALVFAN